jgi:hypothetical protein
VRDTSIQTAQYNSYQRFHFRHFARLHIEKEDDEKYYRGTDNTDRILKLDEIYDSHRDAVLWFLEELDAKNYEEYLEKYSGASSERSHFIAVCGFF